MVTFARNGSSHGYHLCPELEAARETIAELQSQGCHCDRLAEVQRSNQAVLADNRRLREANANLGEQLLKAEEARHRLETALVDAQAEADEAKHELAACEVAGVLQDKLRDATEDEFRLVMAFADKVMGEGRGEHGPLDLSTDTRTAEDFEREAQGEGMDSFAYRWMAEQKRQVG